MSVRLDAALAARGLARSRSHAAALIAAGVVSVDGRPVVKASTPIADETVLEVSEPDHYVSRAAHKLRHGLDRFAIAVAGRAALDMGASTGGFVQVLRERGAEPVVAVDVGHGQLAPRVAADPGVHSVEGFNVRYMTPEALATASGVRTPPSIVTGDLSFISLELVLPAVADVIAPDGDAVLLIKPQFEVGRTAVKGGLVADPATRADAIARVLWAAWDAGLGTLGVERSPLLGTHGNTEYLAHLAPGRGRIPAEWSESVDQWAGGR